RRAAATCAGSGSATSLATTLTATKIRLQQMRECVDVSQLAILHSEQMCVRRTAAALYVSCAERTEHHDRPDRWVHHKAAVGDVHTTWDTDITAVLRHTSARMCSSFGAVAGVPPRHEVFFLFKKRVEVSIGSGDQRVARIALVDGNGVPLF